MTNPRVSVCIPTWRGGAFLESAIRSVLAQTYPDFELIVIDDSSPDDTFQRIEKYGGDPRVRALRNERNLGPQGNWNRCLLEARGAFVKLLPHDDLIAPDCLEVQVAALDANPGAVLAFCDRSIIDAGDGVLMTKRAPFAEGLVTAAASLRRCILFGTNLIGEPGAVLFRRSVADTVGPFDASLPYVVDLDYWVRLLAHGSAWHTARPLSSFRISGASWSVAIGKDQAAQYHRMIDRMAALDHVNCGAMVRHAGKLAARLNNVARRLIYARVLG